MLSLSNNKIEFTGIERLGQALMDNDHLKYLNLSSNPIQNYGISILGKALKIN